MSLTIRNATGHDAPAIAAILRALGWFPHMQTQTSAETAERIRQHIELCARDDSHRTLVAAADTGEVAGYCNVHWVPYLTQPGVEGFVTELFVAQDRRGQGVGGKLLDEVERLARARGCCRLLLHNGSDRDSYQRRFYHQRGWIERTRMANFILPLGSNGGL